MFHFGGFPSCTYVFSTGSIVLHYGGCPIRKSPDQLICSSPRLIAACHVLLRLLMPRHSPYALFRLNFLGSPYFRMCLGIIAWVSIIFLGSVLLLILSRPWQNRSFSLPFRKDLFLFAFDLRQSKLVFSLFSIICSFTHIPLFGFQWTLSRRFSSSLSLALGNVTGHQKVNLYEMLCDFACRRSPFPLSFALGNVTGNQKANLYEM